MKLPDGAYNFLKWLGLIALPALATFYGIVGETWNIPYTTQICTTVTALGTLIGVLIGVSQYNINKGKKDHEESEDK